MFYVEKLKKKKKRMKTNQFLRNRITLRKRYIFSGFELFTYKKRENGWKALYIGKKSKLRETCIIGVLYFHKKHKTKNAKTRVYVGVS